MVGGIGISRNINNISRASVRQMGSHSLQLPLHKESIVRLNTNHAWFKIFNNLIMISYSHLHTIGIGRSLSLPYNYWIPCDLKKLVIHKDIEGAPHYAKGFVLERGPLSPPFSKFMRIQDEKGTPWGIIKNSFPMKIIISTTLHISLQPISSVFADHYALVMWMSSPIFIRIFGP